MAGEYFRPAILIEIVSFAASATLAPSATARSRPPACTNRILRILSPPESWRIAARADTRDTGFGRQLIYLSTAAFCAEGRAARLARRPSRARFHAWEPEP